MCFKQLLQVTVTQTCLRFWSYKKVDSIIYVIACVCVCVCEDKCSFCYGLPQIAIQLEDSLMVASFCHMQPKKILFKKVSLCS